MNQVDIMRLAREAGGDDWGLLRDFMPELERFAKLVESVTEKRLMQLFMDPENQPTQYGTVTFEYMEKTRNEMSWNALEIAVIRWAEERKIVPRSTPLAQAKKTQEELDELVDALQKNDAKEVKDAYGDILVTLIIGAELAGFDLQECLAAAYEEIKDRKGTLGEDGIFYKNV